MILQKINRRRDAVGQLIFTNAMPLERIEMWETMEHVPVAEAMKAKGYKPVSLGARWGKPWSTAWFRVKFRVPASMKGRQVHLRFDCQGQACCFHKGEAIQGLDRNRDEIRILDRARGGETFEFYIEAGANNDFGGFPGVNELRLLKAEIATFNPDVADYFWDLYVLIDLAQNLPEKTPRRDQIIYEVNRSVDAFDFHNTADDALAASAKAARKIVAPLLATRAGESMPTVSMSGHAHIDVAWLWRLRESIRKCSRTFSSVVKYMEEYPYYTFTQSQAELYDMTRTHYPDLYCRIQEWVKKRRWEVMTGMWVEADCNVTGGESLVRQILYGKNFARDEFGVDVNVLWLPDVFGYAAGLPQILRKSGIDYFATIKIHWNEQNKFPYTSFVWQGIDGTEVLAHFPPTGNYNENLMPNRLLKQVEGTHERDRTNHSFFSFGWGDGGGGPTKAMIETAKRVKDLEGLPKSRMRFLGDFFRELDKERDRLPKWVGELYLETHRKTYTTQADNKRNNRLAELLFRDAEFFASMATVFGKAYPRETLDRTWKRILTNQFHDILPGSSIAEVYEDSDAEYAAIHATGRELRDKALAVLTPKVDTRGEGEPVIVHNTLSWTRSGVVEVDCPLKGAVHVVDSGGGMVASERDGKRVRFLAANVPSMGHAAFFLCTGKGESASADLKASARRLENFFWRIDFDAAGRITGLRDKVAGREVLPKGAKANVFQVFEDKPNNFPAWNIDPYYEAKGFELAKADSVEVVHVGELSASVRLKWSFSKTVIEQEIVVYDHDPRIDFITRVDWHERDRFMKVAFPVEVHSPKATYEIQYGHVERPTHRNTSWDAARFEVCAQKWMDLSEPGYGVSLLNNCKYGHDCHGNTMRLTLVCGPQEPDPLADEGEHLFTYALYPHEGDFREAGTIQAAYELNVPLVAVPAKKSQGGLPPVHSWFRLYSVENALEGDPDNVIIEAVKEEERGKRIIVRLYESEGRRSRVVLETALPVKKAHEVDLMEKNLEPVLMEDGRFTFDVKPFEIRTFALEIGKVK